MINQSGWKSQDGSPTDALGVGGWAQVSETLGCLDTGERDWKSWVELGYKDTGRGPGGEPLSCSRRGLRHFKEAQVGTWQQEMTVAVTGPGERFDKATWIQLSHHLNAKYRLCWVYFQTEYTVTTPVTNNKKHDSNAYLLCEMYTAQLTQQLNILMVQKLKHMTHH